MRTQAFRDDEIAVAMTGFVTTLEETGEEVFVSIGERLRGDAPVVRQVGEQYFRHDGERRYVELVEQPDEPPKPPRPKTKMLRSKRDWRGTVTLEGQRGMPSETVHITLHQGREMPETTPWLKALSSKQIRDLFEVVVE